MNHHHRDLRRVARSAECSHVGEAATSPEEIERWALQVYRHRRGVFFTAEQLASMPALSRELIESEARRLCEREKGNG